MGLREDRHTVACLTGLTARYVGGGGEQPQPEAWALQSDLESGHDPHGRVAKVVAILHAVSDNRRLLAEAAAMWCSPDPDRWEDPGYYYSRSALKMLERAGADLGEAKKIRQRRGHGWSTPQADPALHRT